MMTKVFSVYDSKAACFGTPFCMQTVGLAVRAFTELVNDEKSSVNRYPADFTLHQVGEFDDVRGVLIPLEHNVNIGMALEYKRDVPKTPLLPGMDVISSGLTPKEVSK